MIIQTTHLGHEIVNIPVVSKTTQGNSYNQPLISLSEFQALNGDIITTQTPVMAQEIPMIERFPTVIE